MDFWKWEIPMTGSKSTSHPVGRDEISVLKSNNSTADATKDVH